MKVSEFQRHTLSSITKFGYWKPFKNDENCSMLHLLKFFLFSRYLYFCIDFLVMQKTGFNGKIKLILEFIWYQELVNKQYTYTGQYLKKRSQSSNKIWSVERIKHEKHFSWKIINRMRWGNYTQIKFKNWAYLWINCIKIYIICFYCMQSGRMSKYI